jgi:hypothetical protein
VLSCSSDETSTPVTPPAPIAKYTITFSAGDGGSVSTTGGEYEKGQTVTVTATPQGEYVFTGWSDGITDATRTVTIDATKTITANFEKKKYPLTVNIEGEGEVLEEIVNAGRTTDYNSGTTVKLTAQATDGWKFLEWRGDIESTDNPIQILISESKTVTATFEKEPTYQAEFTFKYNIHNSLPSDWISEFYKIFENLENLIPVKPSNYFYELPIYAWLSSFNKPYSAEIGDASGASISGNGGAVNDKNMILEIPYQEFEYNDIHRYSVIPHEYFHVYQMSLSKNFFDGNIELKWMSEGAAATFESLYIQQYYAANYFKEALSQVDIAAINTPSIFEKFNTSGAQDSNYASSVFMLLALSKELQKSGINENEAFKLILIDFWIKNPTDGNWKIKFQETFSITADEFYTNLGSYSNDINTVLPSETLTLESIFKD